MGIYSENGYLDYQGILEISKGYVYIIGGRGVGKSHLTVDIADSTEKPILYVRRTNVDLSNCFAKYSDFSKKDWFGDDVVYKYYQQKGYGFAYRNEEDFENNKPFIVGVSLSTFVNKTGIDFTQFYDVIFDEFIPQTGARPLKHEFQSYKNIMESVFRNRDKGDSDKVRVWFFGNSNAVVSNILLGYRLVGDLYNMVKTGQEIRHVDRCNSTLILPMKSPVSKRKNSNGFYRYLPDAKKQMEIYNNFSDLEDDHVRHQNIKEYYPEAVTPCFTLWLHKTELRYYVTKRMNVDDCDKFDISPSSLERWQKYKAVYRRFFREGTILFASYDVQADFLSSFDTVSWSELLA